jgi:hypothetical protein
MQPAPTPPPGKDEAVELKGEYTQGTRLTDKGLRAVSSLRSRPSLTSATAPRRRPLACRRSAAPPPPEACTSRPLRVAPRHREWRFLAWQCCIGLHTPRRGPSGRVRRHAVGPQVGSGREVSTAAPPHRLCGRHRAQPHQRQPAHLPLAAALTRAYPLQQLRPPPHLRQRSTPGAGEGRWASRSRAPLQTTPPPTRISKTPPQKDPCVDFCRTSAG